MTSASQDRFPAMIKSTVKEAERRRLVIRECLSEVLSADQMAAALSLCDREFPADQLFSSSAFCGRLVQVIPSLNLSHMARLNLLKSMRHQVHETGVDAQTQILNLPSTIDQREDEPQLSSSAETISPVLSQDSSTTAQSEGVPESPPGGPVPSRPSSGPEHVRRKIETSTNHHPVGQARDQTELNRQAQRFPGHYWTSLDDTPTGALVVTRVTASRLCFCLVPPHRLKPGDTLSVQFILDDTEESVIWQRVQVRDVHGNDIESVWLNPEALETSLRPFMLS